jgi:hypothetical protein
METLSRIPCFVYSSCLETNTIKKTAQYLEDMNSLRSCNTNKLKKLEPYYINTGLWFSGITMVLK